MSPANLPQRARVLRQKDTTLGTLLERLATVHGDAPLVSEPGDDGLTLSYAEAADRVARLAGGIRAKIGDDVAGARVVVRAPNGYDFFLLCLAVARAGAIAVPVNDKMTPDEVEYVVTDSDAALVVGAADEVLGEPLDVAAPADAQDVAAIFYTSGTTGKPKGAQLTHAAVLGAGTVAVAYPNFLRRDECVCGMPVAHIAGFTILVMMATMGIPIHLLRRFRPTDALDAIEQRRATMFIGVPAMYRMMDEAGAGSRDLKSIRMWASGADAMPVELVTKFKALGGGLRLPFTDKVIGGATFIDGYGMVELAGGVAMKVSLPFADLPLLPMPGYSLKVVDEQGNEVPTGQVGELCVKGRGVLKGYHGKPEATAEVLQDGWLRTGDLARRQPFGLVSLAGRIKHVIKHGGYSVFAVEVEHALEEHPDILEATVVGLPDQRKGEVPVAAVRLRPGSSATEDDLKGWAKDHLADYKVPTAFRVVDDLPRTGTDKVQKDKVVELFAS